jgi:hypothetical protein
VVVAVVVVVISGQLSQRIGQFVVTTSITQKLFASESQPAASGAPLHNLTVTVVVLVADVAVVVLVFVVTSSHVLQVAGHCSAKKSNPSAPQNFSKAPQLLLSNLPLHESPCVVLVAVEVVVVTRGASGHESHSTGQLLAICAIVVQ